MFDVIYAASSEIVAALDYITNKQLRRTHSTLLLRAQQHAFSPHKNMLCCSESLNRLI